MLTYEAWYTTPSGSPLGLLSQAERIEYSIVAGEAGVGKFTLPVKTGAIYNNPSVDQRVHLWRLAPRYPPQLVGVFFLRHFSRKKARNGGESITLIGHDQYRLLDRRIVAFKASSSQALKTANAVTLLEQIFSENMIPAGDRGDWGELNLTIEQRNGGPLLTKGIAYKPVSLALQSTQASSKVAGDEVFYTLRYEGANNFVFTTSSNQYGQDRTASSPNPLIFSSQFGNITNIELTETHEGEQNSLFIGGRGEKLDRPLDTLESLTRIQASPFNRSEGFVNASQSDSQSERLAEGERRLITKRPRIIFNCDIIPTIATPFMGAGWHVGDRVAVNEAGYSFPAIIKNAHVIFTGKETVRSKMEAVINV